MFRDKRVIDLSHNMWSGQEEYGLEIESRFVDEVFRESRNSMILTACF